MSLYTHATTDAYSWLTVKLDAKTRRDMFWLRFESRLSVKESDSDGDDIDSPVAQRPRAVQRIREPGPSTGEQAPRPKQRAKS